VQTSRAWVTPTSSCRATPPGWVRFDLTTVPANSPVAALGPRRSVAADNGDAVEGLPVIGFWANTYSNGDLGGVLSNYGGSFDHRGSRSVVSALIAVVQLYH
jgi:hypothetical protein